MGLSRVGPAVRNCMSQYIAKALRHAGVVVGEGVDLIGRPIVEVATPGSIVIGDRSRIVSVSRYTALGVAHPCVLRTMTPGARIRIGEKVKMSGASICAAVSVTIGSRTLIGADCLIADSDFHPLSLAEDGSREGLPVADSEDAVKIGKDVFIGARSIVLKGVSIGDGTVVGAGSVVASSLPAAVVAGGNPCKVIRALNPR